MEVFNIYLRGSATTATDALAIKEGFCWPAFLFGPFWALWHRMWFSAAAMAAAYVMFIVGVSVAGANESIANTAIIGVAALIGFAANDWRQSGMLGNGWHLAGLSAAADADAALRRFIDLHPEVFTPPARRPVY
jgi:hypothetical protein